MVVAPKAVKDINTNELRQELAEVIRLSPINRLDSIDGTLKKILETLEHIAKNTAK